MSFTIYLALGIMIIFGSLGGLVNYLRHREENTETKTILIKPILTGVIGAIIIPLILQMISNDTLKWMDSPEISKIDPKLFLIFIAFCAIGGVAGEGLLKAVSDKLVKMIEEAKTQAQNAQKRVDTFEKIMVEPEKDEAKKKSKMIKSENDLTDQEQEILNSLRGAQVRFRSISGLTNQTNLDSGIVNGLLKQLEKKGFVGNYKGKDGHLKWYAESD